MLKMTKEELNQLDCVEIYKLILEGSINKFPKNFWTNSDAVDNATKCIRYLIEVKLRFTDSDIKENLSASFFNKHKLSGMVNYVFNYSPFAAIDSVYPGMFKEWEFKRVPKNFWTVDKGIEVTRWLIEEKLNLSDEEIKSQVSHKLFKDNTIWKMIQTCFDNSPFRAIEATYPGRFKEWEFKNTPTNFWTIDKGIEATKWLIEEKLNLSDEEIKSTLSYKLFADNGLQGMLHTCFKSSPLEVIKVVCPGRFKEWEFKKVPANFWTIDKGIEATKWLIEEKLNLSDEEIKSCVSYEFFGVHGFRGMLNACFNNSPFDAINKTYPGKFKEWELNSVPASFWTKENGIRAVKWLIEEKLNLSSENIKDVPWSVIFREYGLRGMIANCFEGSCTKAIEATYPKKITTE